MSLSNSVESLAAIASNLLGEKAKQTIAYGELTLDVAVADYVAVCTALRDNAGTAFDTCIDLCGVDYSAYKKDADSDAGLEGFDSVGSSTNTSAATVTDHNLRFAVVIHLLSTTKNWRIRVRTYAADDAFPVLPTLLDVWPSVNWYEREAFDLFGMMFTGHPDLRRILTDYGFIGHPLRKDFPVSGHVEMKYDAVQKRVVYQPVSIEPRELTPRIIREEGYAAKSHA